MNSRPETTPRANWLWMSAVFLTLVLAHADRQHAAGQEQELDIPPDRVSTIFTTDTVPGFGSVGGVTADALGYLYIADFRNDVWRLSPDGTLEHYAGGFYGSSGNAIGPSGELYQSNFHGNSITRVARDGQVETFASENLNGPVGIAVSGTGELFVVNCTAGNVVRVTPDGESTIFAEDPRMACPNGLTFDDRGDLYVVSFNHPDVLRITPDGGVHHFASVTGGRGNGHIAFTRGAFFVTQFRGNRVLRLERDGSWDVMAGTGASGEHDGPALEASFTQPNGIAVSPSGTDLWINDLTVRGAPGSGPSLVAFRRIQLTTLSKVLENVAGDDGVTSVTQHYGAYRGSRPLENITTDVITTGYQWLSTGRIAHGLALFEIHADAEGHDVPAQFHFGEALRHTGQNERAAAQYRRVLELQPEHPSASARLTEVTGR